ncbi:aldo/keto reductase [Novosphingobium sp. AP12]|uniref:aldo/keto reductase n=1 Tax=Novosphingobium sp. AP12 TaxID=1144305 RepID=UPI000271E23F|nr:aldo/keto reductase [Novosphingobium sp. AP12]EJL31623.1 aldo/keto reductase, diketogulonate reductase [Novosphingobium sp. AP12]
MEYIEVGGVAIPRLGFGTWQVTGNEARTMVEGALEAGYRHIDTAQIYENESEVGAAIAASGIPRDELFITTKVWTKRFREGDLQKSVDESLERLRLDHVDLLLLHWPMPEPPLEETIAALNDVHARGLTRSIGVSNFPVVELRRAAELSAAPIVTNQIEYHPFLTQRAQIAEMERLGSTITAWSPLARGRIADDPEILAIAQAHGRTAGQVTLRWLLQQPGTIIIPQTSKPSRMAENLDIFDFELTDEEMARLHALGGPEGRTGDWINPVFSWDAE